jgi:hypothetical protein
MTTKVRNPFATLFGRSRRTIYVEQYVLRELARGRRLDDILNDPYVRNRMTHEERVRLLDNPEVVAAVGRRIADELKSTLAVRR